MCVSYSRCRSFRHCFLTEFSHFRLSLDSTHGWNVCHINACMTMCVRDRMKRERNKTKFLFIIPFRSHTLACVCMYVCIHSIYTDWCVRAKRSTGNQFHFIRFNCLHTILFPFWIYTMCIACARVWVCVCHSFHFTHALIHNKRRYELCFLKYTHHTLHNFRLFLLLTKMDRDEKNPMVEEQGDWDEELGDSIAKEMHV